MGKNNGVTTEKNVKDATLKQKRCLSEWKSKLRNLVNREAQVLVNPRTGQEENIIPQTLVQLAWDANLRKLVLTVARSQRESTPEMIESIALGMLRDDLQKTMEKMGF